jgi:hypothetical protein
VAYSFSAIVEQIASFFAIVTPLPAGQIKCFGPFDIANLPAVPSKNWTALYHTKSPAVVGSSD